MRRDPQAGLSVGGENDQLAARPDRELAASHPIPIAMPNMTLLKILCIGAGCAAFWVLVGLAVF